MSIRKTRGVALIIAFLVVVVLLVLGAIFILRSVGEKYASDKEKSSIQSFYVAEGGANAGLEQIDLLINTYMMTTVNDANPNSLVNDLTKSPDYVGNGDGIGFLVAYTLDGGVQQFTQVGDSAVSTVPTTALGEGTYQITITVTENGNPVSTGTDTWEFPYNYVIESTGNVNGTLRKVMVRGDFTVEVQRDNFARYALFTDHHRLESGTTVWFTNKTHFYGPIHTNEKCSFAFNPSGTFDGVVTQHENKAQFYNSGSNRSEDWDYNNEETGVLVDVPTFNAGFTRGVDEINLESSVQKADLADQAWGSSPANPTAEGIYVNNASGSLEGGIYVQGDSTIAMSVDGSGNAVYTIAQGSTTKIITVDYGDEAVVGDEQTTVETVGGPTTTYSGLPDGMDDDGIIIYVDGGIDSLGGTVQKDSLVTISSENDVVIQDNIVYEEYNAGSGTPGEAGYVPPSASGETNLLGLLSWGGDVRIGTSAPSDINIHGTIMARNGIFTVDDYNVGSPRGAATLLGGTITQFYGAFGIFDGATGNQVHGYGRNFIYDGRMATGQSPPYFPSMRTFIAFTNDITDKLYWQEGGI